MSDIKAALQAEIEKMESVCDEIPFGLDEEDEQCLCVMREALKQITQRDAQIARIEVELSGADERSKMIFEAKNRWADRARKAEAQIAALTAENVALKSAIEAHKHGFIRCECCGEENMCHNDDVCRVLDETPATDAAANALRAEGVEMFGDSHYCPDEMQAAINDFASQLREGK